MSLNMSLYPSSDKGPILGWIDGWTLLHFFSFFSLLFFFFFFNISYYKCRYIYVNLIISQIYLLYFLYIFRASEISKKHIDVSSIPEAQELSMFLGTHNSFRTQLKAMLSKISGHEDLIADIVSACLQSLEHNNYLLPEEKHALVKVSYSV